MPCIFVSRSQLHVHVRQLDGWQSTYYKKRCITGAKNTAPVTVEPGDEARSYPSPYG